MLALVGAALEVTKPVQKIPETIQIGTTNNQRGNYEQEPCCR